ncbi:MAG TPA: Glu-tRNA(Gln) amidotransferase subunit GatE [Candidatus Nanoarchaeia archaeon]|nr:Glu-tRNA(Gln) amidotransferase subunit GatE [Candidatus Nanoarchaeia archaeon]
MNNIGFKAGVEIHQQVDGHKLFCSCPCLVNDDNIPDVFVNRKLRVVSGETGRVDQAAAFEMQRDRKFVYQACSSSSCLVELDEEPPHAVNKHALEAALQVCLLLKCKIVRHVQFMRKTVVDGSNVSGFQRTALVGYDGVLQTSKGLVKIDSVCLEEESAKKVEDRGHEVIYRLDRLGVPLIEVATDASLQDGVHVQEVAGLIGMILRSTDKMRRGLGTIRQDINVSIHGHPRVELKGFQDLRSIPKTVEVEVKRQQESVKAGHIAGEVRKVNPDFSSTFLRPMPGADRMYPETDIPLVHLSDELLKSIVVPELLTEKALKLEKKFKLSPELAREVLDIPEFEKMTLTFNNIHPSIIVRTLAELPKELNTRFGIEPTTLKTSDFETIFKALNEKKIVQSAVIDIAYKLAKKEDFNFLDYEVMSDEDLERVVKEIVAQHKGAPFGALMGEVMRTLKGKGDGKKVADLVKKFS